MCGSSCKCSCHHHGSMDHPRTLVDQYFSHLKTIHQAWKQYAPFSWIVYHSFFLDNDCELTEVMSRVSYAAMFYVFVQHSTLSFGPWFYLLPLLPFLMDLLRGFYIGVQELLEPKVERVSRNFFSWDSL